MSNRNLRAVVDNKGQRSCTFFAKFLLPPKALHPFVEGRRLVITDGVLGPFVARPPQPLSQPETGLCNRNPCNVFTRAS